MLYTGCYILLHIYYIFFNNIYDKKIKTLTIINTTSLIIIMIVIILVFQIFSTIKFYNSNIQKINSDGEDTLKTIAYLVSEDMFLIKQIFYNNNIKIIYYDGNRRKNI